MDGERESTPLEDRVVRTLEDRGLLRREERSSGNGRRWRSPAQLAAAVALLLLGGALGAMLGPAMLGDSGRAPSPATATDAPRFALLLYDRAEGATVRDMTLWARELQRRGHSITGAKLERSRVLVSSSGSDVGEALMTGFFVVSAADVKEAEAIARSSPHALHGGRIVIRPVERL